MERYPSIDFGDFPMYKTMGGCGLILGLLLLIYNLKGYPVSEREKDRLLLLLAIAFLSGAGLANVGNWFVMPGLLELPLIQRIQNAGLSFYPGLIGFLIVSAILLRIYKLNVIECLNLVIPSLLLFHVFGRIGCSFGGCCHGKIVNWNIMDLYVMTRFPAREIEAICLFAMLLITQYVIQKHRLIFYLYSYPIIRFVLEYGRGDYRGVLFTNILSPAQLISISIILITSILLIARFFISIRKIGEKQSRAFPV